MSPLSGVRVLVTRPAQQAGALCDLIESAGGHCLRQPLFSIEPAADPAALRQAMTRAEDADWLIFTSANAVEQAWAVAPDWRPRGRLAAIGQATAAALRDQSCLADDREVILPESDFRSEGLLALPAMQDLDGQRVALVTGEGGRGALAEAILARGGQVERLAVYRRLPCPVASDRMQALLGEADIAVLTSGESVSRLVQLSPPGMDGQLRQLQLVVPSNRVLKMALDFGFEHRPLLPEKVNNESILAVLIRWAEQGFR